MLQEDFWGPGGGEAAPRVLKTAADCRNELIGAAVSTRFLHLRRVLHASGHASHPSLRTFGGSDVGLRYVIKW